MTLPFEDTTLKRQALAYVIRLYDELTEENGAPTLGTQNQAVDFILADPELRHAVADWASTTEIEYAPCLSKPSKERWTNVVAVSDSPITRPETMMRSPSGSLVCCLVRSNAFASMSSLPKTGPVTSEIVWGRWTSGWVGARFWEEAYPSRA